jgi:hypothetical protein
MGATVALFALPARSAQLGEFAHILPHTLCGSDSAAGFRMLYLMIALVIVLVLLGGRRIPDMMRCLSEGMHGGGGDGPTAPAVVVPPERREPR